MSFTVIAKNILEEPYKGKLSNVYEQGALINMALELLSLRELSGGEKGFLWFNEGAFQKNWGIYSF